MTPEAQAAIPQKQLNMETETKKHPPIFTGFELYAHNEDGFFIINPADGSIFKWINVENLEENGVYYGEKKKSKGGRRNFEGTVFHCFKMHTTGKGYHETQDWQFKQCIKKFGGFYMATCKARKLDDKTVTFSMPHRIPLNMISHYSAVKAANEYYKKYAKTNNRKREFKSFIPCGAAYDCMFEEIFERFKAEVMAVKQPDELPYDAWNRYEKTRRKFFWDNGVYGIYDLFSSGNETCTEFYGGELTSTYRCGLAHGLYLISDREEEKIELTASFPLGHRNFTVADAEWIDHGYRIMLLPTNIQ